MLVINHHRIRDDKIEQLKRGYTAYCESPELIRLMKRQIMKEQLNVLFEETNSGCWFIPDQKQKNA